MRVVNIDALEWFQVKCSDGKNYILIDKPHINELDWFKGEPIKIGQWVLEDTWRDEDGYLNYEYKCSNCGRLISVWDKKELKEYPYCHCGAKMNKEN